MAFQRKEETPYPYNRGLKEIDILHAIPELAFFKWDKGKGETDDCGSLHKEKDGRPFDVVDYPSSLTDDFLQMLEVVIEQNDIRAAFGRVGRFGKSNRGIGFS